MGGGAVQLGVGHCEWLQNRFVEVVAKRHARCFGHHVGSQFDAGVRVDAVAFGLCNRVNAIERIAASVAEQMTHGAAGLTNRCFEAD